MKVSNARGWPLSVGSSPETLPTTAWMQSKRTVHPMETDRRLSGDVVGSNEILEWINSHSVIDENDVTVSVQHFLEQNNATPMAERRLFLVAGELGNPYRLSDIGIAMMPVIPIRLDGICRTWIDTMDSREVQPGVHHVTLARTDGWWERTLLALPDIKQMRKMTDWLNDGSQTAWRWCKLAEGGFSISQNETLQPPTTDQLLWDGELERVEDDPPSKTGPNLILEEVNVPLYTRQGIYDHRGRIARCVHYPQRRFHNDVYRRGSAKSWDDVISTQ